MASATTGCLFMLTAGHMKGKPCGKMASGLYCRTHAPTKPEPATIKEEAISVGDSFYVRKE
jgi:hypothetical protein